MSIWPFLKLFTNGNFVALLKVVAAKSKLNKQQYITTKSRIQSIWKDRAQIFFIFTNSKAHETQSTNSGRINQQALTVKAFRSEVLCNLGFPTITILKQLLFVIKKLLQQNLKLSSIAYTIESSSLHMLQ